MDSDDEEMTIYHENDDTSYYITMDENANVIVQNGKLIFKTTQGETFTIVPLVPKYIID